MAQTAVTQEEMQIEWESDQAEQLADQGCCETLDADEFFEQIASHPLGKAVINHLAERHLRSRLHAKRAAELLAKANAEAAEDRAADQIDNMEVFG